MFDLLWPAWLWLLVNALAVYRLTRLITDDIITDGLRARVTRLGEPWSSGIECPWCVSFWVSCAVVAVSWMFPNQWAHRYGVCALGRCGVPREPRVTAR